MVRVESLFDRLADVSVTGSYAGHQHFLSSFSLVLVSFLLLDLEHDLKEVPNMPKELDPARHHGAVFTRSALVSLHRLLIHSYFYRSLNQDIELTNYCQRILHFYCIKTLRNTKIMATSAYSLNCMSV